MWLNIALGFSFLLGLSLAVVTRYRSALLSSLAIAMVVGARMVAHMLVPDNAAGAAALVSSEIVAVVFGDAFVWILVTLSIVSNIMLASLWLAARKASRATKR